MKKYFIYLKARWKHRKEIKALIRQYLLSQGELMDYKTNKMINENFSNHLEYSTKTKITHKDIQDYLDGKVNDLSKVITQNQ